MWSTNDFQPINRAYDDFFESLEHADNPDEARRFCVLGMRIGTEQQKLIDDTFLERKAQQIARFQREHPPLSKNPDTRIPYFDEGDVHQAA